MASLLNLACLLNLPALPQPSRDARDRTVSRARKTDHQSPACRPAAFAMATVRCLYAMALYQILLQTGQVGLPPGSYFQQALPLWAYEWVG